ncbi:MAG: DNA polymerase III subunit gamma/tau [Patescibacteria group bacterium]|nr:DNA polymerase III subunit gamma/tau [Patescibacteria group bacterium]
MSLTLYRKYRPQTFAELIGQNHIKLTLENEIKTGAVSHAYLFAGPRGIGKTTVARLMAKALNCHQRKNGEFEPCDQCPSCLEIKEGKSLDMIEVDAASNTQVDKVRDNIVDSARFTPYRDKFKIFIIDEVHMLSSSSFNALLKTMEEPPAHCIFILCTTELYKLPETIVSRCQHFDFRRVDAKVLAPYLKNIAKEEGFNLDDAVVKNIVTLTGGFVRDSLSLLGQVLSLGKRDIKIEDAAAILPRSDFELVARLAGFLIKKNAKEALELVNTLVEEGVDLEHFTADLIEYLRKLILIKLGVETDGWQETGEQMYAQAKEAEASQILKIMDVFMARLNDLKRAEISQLPLEMGVIELCEDSLNNYVPLAPQVVKTAVTPAKTIKKETPVEVKTEIPENKKDKSVCHSGLDPESRKEENGSRIGVRDDTVAAGSDKKQEILINLTLEEINNRWPEVIVASHTVNQSAAIALQTAHVLNLKENNLEIGFEHSFYCERFKEIKARKILEEILKKAFACDFVVKCSVLPSDLKAAAVKAREQKKEAAAEPINMVLEDFGGVVVE